MTEISLLIQHHAGPTGDVLICKNGDGWAFPCGQRRVNEPEEDAVRRIAWEELGMTVSAGKLAMLGHKKPEDGTVEHIPCGNITHNTHTKCNYHCYFEAVDTWQSEPKTSAEYKWVHPSELGQYEFQGDDANFMAKYDPWINARPVPDQRMY